MSHSFLISHYVFAGFATLRWRNGVQIRTRQLYCYFHIYIYIYTYAVGSRTGPHFPFVGPITDPRFPLLFVCKKSSFCGENEIIQKTKLWKTLLKQKSWVNNWSTCAFKHLSQIVDELLTLLWTSYWPNFLHPQIKNNNAPNWLKPLILLCFWRSTHTNNKNKKQKHHTFHICKHNCPLWFWPEVVPLFGPPFLIFPLPPAYLTTWQHKNITPTAATATNKKSNKNNNHSNNQKDNNYSNNPNNKYITLITTTATTKRQQ